MKFIFKIIKYLSLGCALLFYSYPLSAQISDYCATPPFLTATVSPNILFVIDKSGSMSWAAYYATWTATNIAQPYDPNQTYEGYFIPDRKYKQIGGIWQETNDPESCTLTYHTIYTGWGGIYNYYHWYTISGVCLGNMLNFARMSRMDLLRWAITGGKPASCPDNGFTNPNCDPDIACTGATCDLVTTGMYDGRDTVTVPKSRISGIAQTFENVQNRPRFGVLFFRNGLEHNKVYIGDYPNGNNADPDHPYTYFKRFINAMPPSGGTGTAIGMWEAYDYFKQQNEHNYTNGFALASGSGNRYRDPMYFCNANRSDCQLVPCAKNFVILASDGQWNYGGSGPGSTCSIDTGFENYSADPVVPAYRMHTDVLRTLTSVSGQDYSINVSAVYALGLFLGGTGEQSLKNVAIYGSFDTSGKTWPGDLSGYPQNTCYMDDCGNGKGSACTPLPTSSADWDKDNDGNPDTFLSAQTAQEIKDSLLTFIRDILKRTSSGTAVSMLSTSVRGSGNFCQAYFLPSFTSDDNEELSWIGHLKGFWIDPFGQIREDENKDKKLIFDEDSVMKFFFDEGQTNIHLYTSNSNGKVTSPCFPADTKTLADVKTLWDAGKQLWQQSADSRTIYTSTDGKSLISFSDTNTSTLQAYLRSCDETDAENIINYIRGEDVDVCVDSDDGSCTYATCSKNHRSRELTISTEGTHIWKLGDIIYSTPRILSHFPLNLYHILYQDDSYTQFIKENVYDPDQSTSAPTIKRDDYLFVGANDGMLHCFYLGKVKNKFCYNEHTGFSEQTCETDKDCSSGSVCKKRADLEAKLDNGDDAAKELWAYIPMNALPYLKYLAYPDYCHIYYVDQRPLLFDASINGTATATKSKNSWRTILIGEMRFGGYTEPTVCFDGSDNVIDCSDPSVVKKVGLSSIFALDITNPESPSLLWEFSDSDLGFTTSYPAIVRIGSPVGMGQDDGINGHWYIVLGSGPTDYDGDTPPSTGYIYVIDLRDGSLVAKLSVGSDTYIGDCVAVDSDNDYTVEAIYCGTVEKSGSSLTGKMLRILTNESTNASNWQITTFYDASAPVTASPELAFDEEGNLWCFFGTGKYFGQTDKTDETQQYIYGIKDTCWQASSKQYGSCSSITNIFDATNVEVSATAKSYICACEGGVIGPCSPGEDNTWGTSDDYPDSTTTNMATEKIVTEVVDVLVSGCGSYMGTDWEGCVDYILDNYNGWKINLSTSSPAERVISKPAVVGQLAMFTSFIPNDDICGYGGDTYLYSLYYKAGIPYKEPAILLDLNVAFTSNKIQSHVHIGKGAPAIGESIVTKQVGKELRSYVQLSTGEVVEVKQKPVFLPNITQFWIEE